MSRAATVAGALLVGAACAAAQASERDSLAARVRQLSDSYVTAYLERHPDEATLDGVAGFHHDRFPDDSPDAIARWQAREDAWLADLRRIDRSALGGRPEWIAYGILRPSPEGAIATRVCRFPLWNLRPANRG